MKRSNRFATWGDAELDRLWRELYEIELSMDDVDLVMDSPKLKQWEFVNQIFKARMEHLQQVKGRQ